MRVLLVILIGGVLSVVAGMAALPYLINWDDQRARIEAQAEVLTGHDVTVAGPIDFQLLPRPRLSLGDVTLKAGTMPQGNGANRHAIGRIDLDLSLMGLLEGAIVIERIKLIRPAFTLQVAAGRERPGNALVEIAALWRSVSAPDQPLDLTIAQGSVTLTGSPDGRRYRLDDITLAAHADDGRGAVETTGSFAMADRTVRLAGELGQPAPSAGRSLRLQLTLIDREATPVELRFDGTVGGALPSLSLAGAVALSGDDLGRAAEAVSGLVDRPEFAALGVATAPFAWRGQLDLAADRLLVDLTEMTVGGQEGRGRLALGPGTPSPLDLALDLPSVDLAKLPSVKAMLASSLIERLLAQPGTIELRIGTLRHRGDAIRQLGLKVAIGADRQATIEQAHALLPGRLYIRVDGRIAEVDRARRLDGRIEAVGDDLGATLAWLGVTLPKRPEGALRAVSMTADLAAEPRQIRLSDLALRFDASRVAGQAELDLAERPALTAQLEVDRLTLDQYGVDLSASGLGELVTAALRPLDVALDLQIRRLSWGALRGAELELQAAGEADRLTLDRLTLRAFEATAATAHGTVELEPRRFELTTELRSDRLSQALRRLGMASLGTLDRLDRARLKSHLQGRLEKFDLAAELEIGDAGRAKFDGTVGWSEALPDYDLIVEASHPDIYALLQQLGRQVLFVATPEAAPIRLAGRIKRDPAQQLSLSGSIRIGPTSLTGRVTRVEDLQPRPQLLAEVSVGNLQPPTLAALLALAGIRPTSDPLGPIEPGSWSTMPWPIAWLGQFDGELRLTGKGGLLSDRFELSARLKDRFLYVDRLALAAWHGTVAAELSLDGREAPLRLAAAADLGDVDAAGLVRWLGARPGLEGALDVHLETTSSGPSLHEMMRSLAGEVRVELTDGALAGYDAARLKRTLESAPAPNQAAGGGPATDERTDLLPATISGTFALQRGIAEAKAVAIAVDGVRGVVEGSIDIFLGVTDLALHLQSEGEESVLFKIVGPLRRPQTLLRRSAQVGVGQPLNTP